MATHSSTPWGEVGGVSLRKTLTSVRYSKPSNDMINRDDILRPLGGEHTLRLMCEADCFVYVGDVCHFGTPKHNIRIGHYHDSIDKTPRWSLVVNLKGELGGSLHRSSSIMDPGVVARIFEWSTQYSLTF